MMLNLQFLLVLTLLLLNQPLPIDSYEEYSSVTEGQNTSLPVASPSGGLTTSPTHDPLGPITQTTPVSLVFAGLSVDALANSSVLQSSLCSAVAAVLEVPEMDVSWITARSQVVLGPSSVVAEVDAKSKYAASAMESTLLDSSDELVGLFVSISANRAYAGDVSSVSLVGVSTSTLASNPFPTVEPIDYPRASPGAPQSDTSTDYATLMQQYYREEGPADLNQRHTILLAVKHEKDALAKMQNLLEKISDPSSHMYGQWLTAEGIRGLHDPQKSARKIEKFLTSFLSPGSLRQEDTILDAGGNDFNITISAGGDYVSLCCRVSELNRLFRTTLHKYISRDGHVYYRASTLLTIHPKLRDLVEDALHVNDFPAPLLYSLTVPTVSESTPPSTSTSTATSSTDPMLLPFSSAYQPVIGTLSEIRNLYTFSSSVAGRTPVFMSQAAVAGDNQYFSREDLGIKMRDILPCPVRSKYVDNLVPPSPYMIATFDSINGISYHADNVIHGLNQSYNASTQVDVDCTWRDCLGGNLMTQVLMGLTTPRDENITTYYDTTRAFDPFVSILMQLHESSDPPQVVVIGYGTVEVLVHASTMSIFSKAMMKLALRGVTVITSSGDSGISGPLCWCDKGDGYFPMFPASVPFVTTVGGTLAYKTTDEDTGGRGYFERACQANLGSSITSGGGFSGFFETPAYQQASLEKYRHELRVRDGKLPLRTRRALKGRGYPDIALLSSNFEIVVNGMTIKTDSTIGAAAQFAAMVTMINVERASLNLTSLGFLNKLLYQLGDAQYSSPDASPDLCSSNDQCKALGLSGECCPTRASISSNGVYLACCDIFQPQPSPVFIDIVNGSNACCTNSLQCCDSGYDAGYGWDPITGLGSLNFSALLNRTLHVEGDEGTDDRYKYSDDFDDDDYGGGGMGFDRLNFLLGSIAMASVFFLILEFVIENWAVLCGEGLLRSCFREWRFIWRQTVGIFTGNAVSGDGTDDSTDEDEMIPINRAPRRGPQVHTTVPQ